MILDFLFPLLMVSLSSGRQFVINKIDVERYNMFVYYLDRQIGGIKPFGIPAPNSYTGKLLDYLSFLFLASQIGSVNNKFLRRVDVILDQAIAE